VFYNNIYLNALPEASLLFLLAKMSMVMGETQINYNIYNLYLLIHSKARTILKISISIHICCGSLALSIYAFIKLNALSFMQFY